MEEGGIMHLTANMHDVQKNTFLYFAYGSNLLTERIRINNPSAKKLAIGKLDGYRLDFNLYGRRWRGAVATIVPDEKAHVWGVIWELANADMKNLDIQETGYDPICVPVLLDDGQQFECRSYLVNSPLIADSCPSLVYKNVIIRGAIEHQLPETYIQKLYNIKDNGYNGPVEVSLRNG